MNKNANKNILLGVNIDHVATLRQQRHTIYPEPILAMIEAEKGGADGITVHLREDRRHIQPEDVRLIKAQTKTRLNLEMAVTNKMLEFAELVLPQHCCFVPEKREELTTEGGLDIIGSESKIKEACERLAAKNIEVSLFIDPDRKQIEAAVRVKAPVIEIHTGAYADAINAAEQQQELNRIIDAAEFAASLGLIVNGGHGLNYDNVVPIAKIPQMHELNIGHSLVSFAIFYGIENAVRKMKQLMIGARNG